MTGGSVANLYVVSIFFKTKPRPSPTHGDITPWTRVSLLARLLCSTHSYIRCLWRFSFLQRRGGPVEAPAVGGNDAVLRPLQGLAQDGGGAGEDEDARAQERQSGHALLGLFCLRRPHPGIRARLLPPLLTDNFYSVCCVLIGVSRSTRNVANTQNSTTHSRLWLLPGVSRVSSQEVLSNFSLICFVGKR